MRHRLGYNKLNRDSAHRMLMLRNLVSSLFQHAQVMTTRAKAKEAQRLAEKMITLAKKGGKHHWDMANAFLLQSQDKTMTPLFTNLAQRYKDRTGGYTRVKRAGFRKGDNAEVAILELVDNKNDLKFEWAARAVGREMAVSTTTAQAGPSSGTGKSAWSQFRDAVLRNGLNALEPVKALERLTKQNVKRALAFREGVASYPLPSSSTSQSSTSPTSEAPEADESAPSSAAPAPAALTQFLDRAHHHYLRNLAMFRLATTVSPDPTRQVPQLASRLKPTIEKGPPVDVVTVPQIGRVPKAGERTDGWAATADLPAPREPMGPLSRAKGQNGPSSRFRM